jgi:hypothetical protein
MAYEFLHEGNAYTPDGDQPRATDQTDVDARNREIEAGELDWLRTGPDRVFLYVGPLTPFAGRIGHTTCTGQIQTWLGTALCTAAIGPARKFRCWGYWPSVRRSVDCRIFGVRYVGWYMESSGSYCRLRKARRQRDRVGRRAQ